MEFASYRMADRSGRHIATANVPKGLLFAADKDDAFQSRNRPFRLVFKCVQNKDGTGNQLYADTGEFFVEDRYFGLDLTGSHNRLMNTNGQDNLFGGEVRRFTSVEGYLDDCTLALFDQPPRRLLRTEFLDKTPQQVEADELVATRKLCEDYDGSGAGRFRWVGYRALDRTVIRYYDCVNDKGEHGYLAMGANMGGNDILVYDARTGIRSVSDRSAPFGHAPSARAASNYIVWWSRYRFATSYYSSDVSFGEFCDITRALGRSVSFDDELLRQMSAESDRLSRDSHERMRRETEANRRRLEEAKSIRARQEAERARLAQMRAHEQATSRARREAWDRQQEADRRRRNAWSDAIRDVDRYEHPYDGSTIEVRTGHGHRAFYNPAEDRVITADSDIDIPFGYEELRRKF